MDALLLYCLATLSRDFVILCVHESCISKIHVGRRELVKKKAVKALQL